MFRFSFAKQMTHETQEQPLKKQRLDPLALRIERHKASFDPACEALLKLNDSELKHQLGERTEGLGRDRSKLDRLKAADPAAARAKWSAAHSEAGRVVEELRRQLRDAERKQEEARRELDTLEETEREIDSLEAKVAQTFLVLSTVRFSTFSFLRPAFFKKAEEDFFVFI